MNKYLLNIYPIAVQLLGYAVLVATAIFIARAAQQSDRSRKVAKTILTVGLIVVAILYALLGAYAFIGLTFLGDIGGESGSAFVLLALMLGAPVLGMMSFLASLPGVLIYYLLYKPEPVKKLIFYGWTIALLILGAAPIVTVLFSVLHASLTS